MNASFRNVRREQILYTGIAECIAIGGLAVAHLRFIPRAENDARHRSLMRIAPIAAHFEAQMLCGVLPEIPAHRTKLPHLVYEMLDYRMQNVERCWRSNAATGFLMSKKSTRADLACQALRQAIIEQALPPGTKLPEDELGKRFAMSRTLVRAALAQLQSEGLVDAPPRRTATTAKPTVEEAREVFEVRRLLERDVVRLVIERWKPEFGAELEGHVREEEAANKAGNARVSGRLAGEFHVKLADLSGNRLLRRYLGEVVSRCSLILALYGRPHSADCSVREHREIVAALRGRNAEAASAVMEHHLGLVEHRALSDEDRDAPFDLGAVLSRYADRLETASAPKVARLPKRKIRASQ
jgi:DNA-binding GntR family transcriptional regulator